MRNNNKSKIPSFLLGLSFTPDVSSGSYQGLSCSKTGSPTGSQLPSVHSHSVGSSMGAGEPLLWHLEHPLPILCTDPGVCRVVSLSYSLLSPCSFARCIFTPSWTVLTTLCLSEGLSFGQWWVPLGLTGLILSDVGKAGIFSHKPPLQPQCYQNLTK